MADELLGREPGNVGAPRGQSLGFTASGSGEPWSVGWWKPLSRLIASGDLKARDVIEADGIAA